MPSFSASSLAAMENCSVSSIRRRPACASDSSPRLRSTANPSLILTLNNSTAATVDAVDISWDVIRPSSNTAMQTLIADKDSSGAGGTHSDSGPSATGLARPCCFCRVAYHGCAIADR